MARPALFLPRARLCRQLKITARANIVLVAQNAQETLNRERIREQLAAAFTTDDAELELRKTEHAIHLQSKRVFLHPSVEAAALQAGTGPSRFLSYFVHSFVRDVGGDAHSPFVFVTATDDESLTDGIRDNELAVTEWLADDLDVQPGALLRMSYLEPAPGSGNLELRENTVMIKRVLPLEHRVLTRELAPPFPGLTDVEDCADWDPGIPLDLEQLRDKDEAYWDRYGPAPRAVLTLDFGQKLWGTRFGGITSVRYPAKDNSPSEIREALTRQLSPDSLGVRVNDDYAVGMASGHNTVNFAQLFVGLSGFLLLSAFVLVALLFLFTVEQRDRQTGLLRALGFTDRRIGRLLTLEGMALTLFGILPGILAGVLYNLAVMAGLSSIWQGAVGTRDLSMQVRWQSLAWGGGITLFLSWITLALAARHQLRVPGTINLLHHEGATPIRLSRRSPLPAYVFAVVLAVAAVAVPPLMEFESMEGSNVALVFFVCGSLALFAAFGASYGQIIRLTRQRYGINITLRRMSWRNLGRRPLRSMATILMLGCGTFLVLAIGGNHRLAGPSIYHKRSGTGGFAFYGESALPLDLDLLDSKAESDGLPARLEARNMILPLLTRGNAEANCLNLHRVDTPRLLGTDPGRLAEPAAFRFLASLPPERPERPQPGEFDSVEPDDRTESPETAGEERPERPQPGEFDSVEPDDRTESPETAGEEGEAKNPWTYLSGFYGRGVVPAIADSATVRWGLNKNLGDTIAYTDERGQRFLVKLVGIIEESLLQGSLVVDRRVIEDRFASSADTRVLLVDAPEELREPLRSALLDAFGACGLELIPAGRRLESFLRVQNTYLSIFLVLGGLGLLIGTAGMAVVISRNTSERVREFAILRATGFSRLQIRALITWEHAFLASAAILSALAGTAAGALPPLILGGSRIPWRTAGLVLAGLTAACFFWVSWAAARNTRGALLDALRHE